MGTEPIKIIGLDIENVLRLEAVSLNMEGNTLVIGGENEQGKSSILDSIEMAFAGEKHIPAVPIHKGADKGRIVVKTDKYTVERTFTDKGSYLKVSSADGFTAKSPQSLLDTLVGDLSFDPLAFTRMDAAKQAQTFMRLLHLDFTDLDAEYKQVEADRRDIGRDGQSEKSLLASIPEDADAPSAEVSVSALVADLEAAEETNRQNHFVRGDVENWQEAVNDNTAEITTLETQLAKAKADLAHSQKELASAQACTAKLKDIDTEPIRAQIANAETINRRVRKAAEREQHAARYAELETSYKAKTARLEAIKADKAKQIAAAKFPIEGIGFDASGITSNGLPFAQESSAKQLQIAVAMGLSANPTLRIVLIRDGSLLDNKHLAAIAEMAKQYDAQVFMERVGDGKEVNVVIHDGKVLEDRNND